MPERRKEVAGRASGNTAKRRKTSHDGKEPAEPMGDDCNESPPPEALAWGDDDAPLAAGRAAGDARVPNDSGAFSPDPFVGTTTELPLSPAGPMLTSSHGDMADLEDGTSECGATASASHRTRQLAGNSLAAPVPSRLLLPSAASDANAVSMGSRLQSDALSDLTRGSGFAPSAGVSAMLATTKAGGTTIAGGMAVTGSSASSAGVQDVCWLDQRERPERPNNEPDAFCKATGVTVDGQNSDDELLTSFAGRATASGDEGLKGLKDNGASDDGSSDDENTGGREHRRDAKEADIASDSSSDDEPLVPGPKRTTASPASDSDSESEPAKAAGQSKPEISKATGDETGAIVGESESDSDSESSSSSSSSSSESESEEMVKDDEPGQELVVLDRLEKERRDLEVLRGAHLRRDELVDLLLDLPEEEAENAILRSFVRLTVQVQPGAQDACVIAEVVAIEYSPPYSVTRRNGDPRTLKVQIRCKRGSSTRLSKISSVSNQDVTENEFEQWKKLTNRTGVDVDHYIEQMKQKAIDINAAKNFTFDDLTVARMLKNKPETEFDAQKESRYRFLVQCALSQMDISGIRDYEAEELEDRYKQALDKLHVQEARSTQTQANWFKNRPNLYSLKEINKKNLERQAADDRHALMYTLATETSGKEGLNPFQRRACRPVVAWDTKLTLVEGLDTTKPTETTQESGGAAAPAQPDPMLNGMTSGVQETEQLAQVSPAQPRNRLDSVLQAHRQSNLLSKLGALTMTQEA